MTRKTGEWSCLSPILKRHAGLWAAVMLAVLLETACGILVRRMLSSCIDGLAEGAARLLAMAPGLLAVFALAGVIAYLRPRLSTRLQHLTRGELYRAAYARLQGQVTMTTGELTSLLTQDVQAVIDALTRLMTKAFSDVFCFVLTFALLITIHPTLALIVLAVTAVPSACIARMSRAQTGRKSAFMQAQTRANEVAAESLYSLESIQAGNLQEHAVTSFGEALTALLHARKRMERQEAAFNAPSLLCAFALQLAMVIVGGVYAASGAISLGDLFAIISLMDYIVTPMMSLGNTLSKFHTLNVSLGRLAPLIGDDGRAPRRKIMPTDSAAGVELDHVFFAYTPEKPIFSDFSLRMTPGACHVIVGENGAGKSTLLRLLTGALRPTRGDIVLCGQRCAPGCDLSPILTVMPQESLLLHASVAENVRLGVPDAPIERVRAACESAGIHEEIMALPGGYDTVLGEGGGVLSGGQKQRLALARALLRDAPVMIFDEPTSALDDANAARVGELLHRLARGRTVVIVSHDSRIMRPGDDMVEVNAREQNP